MKVFIILALICFSTFARSEWLVDTENSHVGFASVKNKTIAENHRLSGLTGSAGPKGEVLVNIDLATVETLVPIRNERIREMLFDVANFPTATIKTKLDMKQISSIPSGETQGLRIPLTIGLKSVTISKSVTVKIVRSGENIYDVTSADPIMIRASDFSLLEGVKALKEIAGLQSIEPVVPVTFNLRFVRETP
ncbi:MAG: polyisoprenoid-binding protein [Gammaproteobacteria bacterium]|nr:polyisoprenoid-binding protein [Gammaproteobacteria bacterium]